MAQKAIRELRNLKKPSARPDARTTAGVASLILARYRQGETGCGIAAEKCGGGNVGSGRGLRSLSYEASPKLTHDAYMKPSTLNIFRPY